MIRALRRVRQAVERMTARVDGRTELVNDRLRAMGIDPDRFQ